jgi:hypothetical protein
MQVLSFLAHQAHLYLVTIAGVAISYLWLRMPRVPGMQRTLTSLTGWTSKTALARLEFVVVLVIGSIVVHELVVSDDARLAFTSGLSWYTLVGGRARP